MAAVSSSADASVGNTPHTRATRLTSRTLSESSLKSKVAADEIESNSLLVLSDLPEKEVWEADVITTSASESSFKESLMILIALSDESRARNPARSAGEETSN